MNLESALSIQGSPYQTGFPTKLSATISSTASANLFGLSHHRRRQPGTIEPPQLTPSSPILLSTSAASVASSSSSRPSGPTAQLYSASTSSSLKGPASSRIATPVDRLISLVDEPSPVVHQPRARSFDQLVEMVKRSRESTSEGTSGARSAPLTPVDKMASKEEEVREG
ncbi:unnamed protein product [Protopolystoma xenopodis]|uniref:Uncharacterized protein n=1 Tax=Protopolystoma xenopodis TaxID=117903 RepID=A0A3S5C1Z4_9PLAT|nr:unnamed protein product [Protopolystoma xenopodis]